MGFAAKLLLQCLWKAESSCLLLQIGLSRTAMERLNIIKDLVVWVYIGVNYEWISDYEVPQLEVRFGTH
jgi:hypothetical protein